ncbi:MAG: lamin tail domain-containing protein [Deltaproteobacteria bacterium]|nr:lamin tail domain-containing protein [Deltaproteobacteria bacterium]
MKKLRTMLTVLAFSVGAFAVIGCDDDSSSNNTNNTTNNTTNNANCGNGVIDEGEECDLTALDDQTCSDQGYTGGELSCNTDCTFNTDMCTGGCTDECAIDTLVCNGTVLRQCVMDDNDECTVWSETDCADNSQTCAVVDSVAQCTDDCSDECTEDTTRCSETAIEVCAVQASGCTDWQAEGTDCADTTQECRVEGGAAECYTPCVPECTEGELRCSGTAIQICENPGDDCTFWDVTDTDCADTSEVCVEDGSGDAVCEAPPSGEDCSDAIPIYSLPYSISGDSLVTDFPGNDFDLDDSCETAYGVDAVFEVNLTGGATYVIQNNTTLDTVLHVMETCSETGSCVASMDGAWSGPETLLYNPETDGTYFIVLEAYSSSASTSSPYSLLVYELDSTESDCADGIDNDANGYIDCADGACNGVGSCGTENTDAFCGDSIDNDGDGDIDCEDDECYGHGVCGDENTTAFCSDGIDNDNDGDIDCVDTDCYGVTGACDTELDCSDGIDNDLDGAIDCADHTDCDSVGACVPENTTSACSDSFDNDGDGLVDCDDEECQDVQACMPRMGIWEQFRTSGLSNPIDLTGMRLVFSPDGSGDYTWQVTGDATYLVEPGSTSVGSEVAGDSAVFNYALPFTFDFYGESYNELWITTDGYITFNEITSTDYSESESDLFASPKIAVAWADLTNITGGDLLYVDQGNDALSGRDFWAFTYHMRDLGDNGVVNAQVVLFEDGEIRIDYLLNELVNSITGISSNGLEPNPPEVEFVSVGKGAVIFTEILANSDFSNEPVGEFFEVYNTTGSEIDLTGCEIIDGGTLNAYVAASVTIPPYGYLAFENKGVSGTDGLISPSENITQLGLGNGGDWISLTCAGILVDYVAYTGSRGGVSLQLNPTKMDADSNDDPSNWCYTEETATYEVTDGTVTHYMTPGSDNHACPQNVILEETFDGGVPPTNWTTYTYDATNVDTAWMQCDDCGSTLTNSEGPFAYISTYSGEYADNYLELPSLDLTTETGVELSFVHYYYYSSSYYSEAEVQMSLDGGTTWDPIRAYTASTSNGAQEIISLVMAEGEADVRIRFWYSGDNSFYWRLDTVRVTSNF